MNYNGRVVRLPQRSLGANEWIVGRDGWADHEQNGHPVQPLAEADIRRPAETPFAAD